MWSMRIRAGHPPDRGRLLHPAARDPPPRAEASDGIEVIEIGVPAEHVTEIDHEMTLPTPNLRPDREWQGQRFVHNVGARAPLGAVPDPGLDRARHHDQRAIPRAWPRPGASAAARHAALATRHDGRHPVHLRHGRRDDAEGEGKDPYRLSPGDAFVIPPGMTTRYAEPSADLELLEVVLPGNVPTELL